MRYGAVYPSLKGRTVLVTGGGSGIGEAVVRHFAAQGARVGFIDVKEASDMPVIADPFFQGVSARITFTPVMNLPDFQAGMAKLAKASG